jgi:transcription elongation GreA/GreB family factor
MEKNEYEQQLQETVDINDTVTVSMSFQNGIPEIFRFKLISMDSVNYDPNVSVVSINSPLGRNVYGHSVGFAGQYNVDGSSIVFTIINSSKVMDMPTEKILKRTI